MIKNKLRLFVALLLGFDSLFQPTYAHTTPSHEHAEVVPIPIYDNLSQIAGGLAAY